MRNNRLTFLEQLPEKSPHGKSIARYQCDCGSVVAILVASVRSGRTKSCGCLQRQAPVERFTTHGLRRSPEYRTWCNIQQRVKPTYRQAADYHGRGITVCERWSQSFDDFFADMGPRPSAKHTIERVDNAKSYEPGNCVWATRNEQARNTRRNRFLTHDGERLTVAEWARRLGCSHELIRARLRNGWTVEQAVTIRPDRRGGLLRSRLARPTEANR